ncbi:MAG: 3-oxoacyl-[acyl-carrier-protein] synthase III C-terminal domain-containing protein, partial [Ignavibacteria bacterium]
AMVLLVAVELCSLTFLKNDLSKSNFIATGIFSDGVAAVLIKGNEATDDNKLKKSVRIIDSRSKLYYDSLDVMGWEILNTGFKVIFSKDIPTIVNNNVHADIIQFLDKHNLQIMDIKNFVVHPGGTKVIEAYINALSIDPVVLNNTSEILYQYGNMSSTTVLYVLNKFIEGRFENGYGLMMSLGPGFSSEMVLLKFDNGS